MKKLTLFSASLAVVALLLPLALVLSAGAKGSGSSPDAVTQPQSTTSSYEVWVMDQSDTAADGGGRLFVYPGDALTAAATTAEPEVIDLGGEARSLCLQKTGTAPKRPHMVMVNQGQTHAVLTFVATGHVLFIEVASRAPVACIDVGEQAHAAYPSPDESYVIVANQNGKLLQRIRTDYETGTFIREDEATLNLATCATPSGATCEDPT